MKVPVAMIKPPEMDSARLVSRIHARLSILRSELRAALHQAGSPETRALANHLEETGDEAVSNLEVAIDIADLHRDITEFNALRGALRRVSQGTYGTCTHCGRQILLARLCVQPEAERCVGCQTRSEAERGVLHSSL